MTNDEGGSIVIGTAVYCDVPGGVKKARANAIATAKSIGLVQDTTIASAGSGVIMFMGVLTATTGQWDAVTGGSGGLTAGNSYYVSTATAGLITDTAPNSSGNYAVKIGVAISTTQMIVHIDTPIAL